LCDVQRIIEQLMNGRAPALVQFGVQHVDGTNRHNFEGRAHHASRASDKAAAKGQLTWMHLLREASWDVLTRQGPVELRTSLLRLADVTLAWLVELEGRTAP
jgi:hypothetical protein